MNCHGCGKELNSSSKFCNGCGLAAPAYIPCPFCAEPIRVAARLCRYCKSNIPQLQNEVAPAPIVAVDATESVIAEASRTYHDTSIDQHHVEEAAYSGTDLQATKSDEGVVSERQEVAPTTRESPIESTYYAATASQSPSHPWLRYWARMFDLAIYTSFISLLIAVPGAIIELLLEEQLKSDPVAKLWWDLGFTVTTGITAWVTYWFVEALNLSLFGTTLGKWMYGIRLRRADGAKLTYREALVRALRVWWRGLALNVLVATHISQVLAYIRLSNRGSTSWDEDGKITVIHGRVGLFRLTFCLMVTVPITVVWWWIMVVASRLHR